ncbi:glycosyltransferase family 2 protein [Entomobacter blattae]|uniref:Glycosyl transferase family 2 n=1 Tax=Entomobacter blattae TaxID=2762277 RepID=A0A7H1NTF1_9PROT|nr:glycosyltransferase family 2 protein [Entomobacter blattae]QNT79061.1 Glycosyl transferase family 2 [Entomobacter blattae]
MSSDLEKFIWGMQTPALRDQPLGDPTSWAGTVQGELLQFGEHRDMAFPTREFPAYQFAAAILMVKNEADVISENLWWLYFIGVRRFIVINNKSTDNTGELVKDFQKYADHVEVIIIDDPIIAHYQSEKTTSAYVMANLLWPDLRWIIPVDADEFFIPQNSLETLDSVPETIDAVVVTKLIHCHYSFYKPSTALTNLLQEMAYRCPLFAVPPKIVVRAHLEAHIAQGNHFIKKKTQEVAHYTGGLSYGLYIREFPNRSFEYFLDKIRNGARAIMEARKHHPERSIGGEHWLEYYTIYQQQGLEAILSVYRQNYIRDHTPGWKLEPFSGVPLNHPYRFFLDRDRAE